MRRRSLVVAGILAVIVAGCGKDEAGPARSPAGYAPARSAPARESAPAPTAVTYTAAADSTAAPSASTPADGDAAAPMIIRTGSATLEADSLEAAVAAVRAMAARLGGYVADVSMETGREQLRSASLELKIPAQRFDEAIAGLRPIGHVETVNVSAQDVGEEYADVAAREANARRLEQRLIALLERRTGKLEEVLAVERELARVREEIERMEGRMRYLRAHVATSTLTVTVHEPRPLVADAHGATGVMADAFAQAWRNFVGFVAGFVALLGILVPLAALAALGWWIVRVVRRRESPKGEERKAA